MYNKLEKHIQEQNVLILEEGTLLSHRFHKRRDDGN